MLRNIVIVVFVLRTSTSIMQFDELTVSSLVFLYQVSVVYELMVCLSFEVSCCYILCNMQSFQRVTCMCMY